MGHVLLAWGQRAETKMIQLGFLEEVHIFNHAKRPILKLYIRTVTKFCITSPPIKDWGYGFQITTFSLFVLYWFVTTVTQFTLRLCAMPCASKSWDCVIINTTALVCKCHFCSLFQRENAGGGMCSFFCCPCLGFSVIYRLILCRAITHQSDSCFCYLTDVLKGEILTTHLYLRGVYVT